MQLRLKTKLVLAISGLVVVVVVVWSWLYVTQVVRQRFDQAHDTAEFVANQVFHATREALAIDLSSTRIDMDDEQAVRELIEESLQTDAGLDSLLQSVIGYAPTIYDVAITDADERALLHTNGGLIGTRLEERPEFSLIRNGGIRQQLKVVYGPPAVYEVRVPLERNGVPFGSIRVGLSTVFLKSALERNLNAALLLSGIAILTSLIVAAAVSNFALRPLARIRERLDRMAEGDIEPALATANAEQRDEYGAVNTRIDRIGRQMRDVKEVFSALKENLDQIMANLQDGIVLFTRNHRAVLVSASVEEFLEKPRGELLGRSAEEIFAENTPLASLVRDAFTTHTPITEREIVRPNGGRTQVSLDFIEERGENIGALLTLRDAERARKIEDEIELSRRLAAIGRLTSGVAHEVKNPINAIVVHLEVLRQKLQQVDPDTRRHMDVIGSEIHRLDRVVQTLVDFTRPVELRLAPTDLRRLVNDVVLLAAPDASRHGIEIVPEMPRHPLPTRIDADLVKQAVLNIVINAVQAMPDGGKVFITGERLDDCVELRVRDTGPGIPPEVQDKIFNLYFTTKKGGSGIGLAMSYRVMQLHQGSLDFETGGQGTTFRLSFPHDEPQATKMEEDSEAYVRDARTV